MAKKKSARAGKQPDEARKAGSDGGTGKRQGDPEAMLLSSVTGKNVAPGHERAGPVHDRGSGKRQGDSEDRLVKRVARESKAKP